MDNGELIHRGFCRKKSIEGINENQERISSFFDTCAKLDDYDWFRDIPQDHKNYDVVEIRFKNTRKAFYRNTNQLRLKRGDIVAVEASPGHDIGIVCLTGEIVALQMKKLGIDQSSEDLKKVYRKAKQVDIDKWKEAIDLEKVTMLKSRKIAENLNLEMKIGDVEYQGDKTKAIFYYIADIRVDFRELIKKLAEEFKIRIEMRQIGTRQEAGRIGGIGPCGRELCCATWITSFISVTTAAARYQEVSLNPQKLAGQCGKLKCCLNYEVTSYIDAQKNFPDKGVILKTRQGDAFYQKTDIYRGIYWYSFDKNSTLNLIPVPVEKVKEIIEANNAGDIPDILPFLLKEEKEGISFSSENAKDEVIDPQESKLVSSTRKKKKKKKNNLTRE